MTTPTMISLRLQIEPVSGQTTAQLTGTIQALLRQAGLSCTVTDTPSQADPDRNDAWRAQEEQALQVSLTRLVTLHRRFGLSASALDERTHDAGSSVSAAAANNAGPAGQTEFLLRNGWNEQDVRAALGEAYTETRGDPDIMVRLEGDRHELLMTLNATPWVDRLPLGVLSALLTQGDQGRAQLLDDLLDTFEEFDPDLQRYRREGRREEIRATMDAGNLLTFLRSKARRNPDIHRLCERFTDLTPSQISFSDLSFIMRPLPPLKGARP